VSGFEDYADLIAELAKQGNEVAEFIDGEPVEFRAIEALRGASAAQERNDGFGPNAHLYTVEAMRQEWFTPTFCQGCNIPVTPDGLAPTHCGFCPPWDCPDCGGKDSMATPCSCWVPLEGKNIADLKAIFAADGTFSIDPKPTDSTKEADHG